MFRCRHKVLRGKVNPVLDLQGTFTGSLNDVIAHNFLDEVVGQTELERDSRTQVKDSVGREIQQLPRSAFVEQFRFPGAKWNSELRSDVSKRGSGGHGILQGERIELQVASNPTSDS